MLSFEWDEELYREVLKDEGREQGLEQGREQERIEVARRLKSEGAEPALISKVTGLTESEVEAL